MSQGSRSAYTPFLQPCVSSSFNPNCLLQIIESTLREGEQFASAWFDTETKIEIAKALDDFGADCKSSGKVRLLNCLLTSRAQDIELTSPAASNESRLDCIKICGLGLKSKILTHIR
jgi:homocitrate synthase